MRNDICTFSLILSAASGFQTGIKRKREEEDDGDLNIDGDDSEEYGKPQYPIKPGYLPVNLVYFSAILVYLSVKLIYLSFKLVYLFVKPIYLSNGFTSLSNGFICVKLVFLSVKGSFYVVTSLLLVRVPKKIKTEMLSIPWKFEISSERVLLKRLSVF